VLRLWCRLSLDESLLKEERNVFVKLTYEIEPQVSETRVTNVGKEILLNEIRMQVRMSAPGDAFWPGSIPIRCTGSCDVDPSGGTPSP
jgi:hypothetical protein